MKSSSAWFGINEPTTVRVRHKVGNPQCAGTTTDPDIEPATVISRYFAASSANAVDPCLHDRRIVSVLVIEA